MLLPQSQYAQSAPSWHLIILGTHGTCTRAPICSIERKKYVKTNITNSYERESNKYC